MGIAPICRHLIASSSSLELSHCWAPALWHADYCLAPSYPRDVWYLHGRPSGFWIPRRRVGRASELHADPSVDVAAFERRPRVDSPSPVCGSGRAKEGIPASLPHTG